MIEVRNLSFAFPDNVVFDDLSFILNDCPVTAFLGLNGEGKTTLIRLLLGLLKPDKGNILIDKHDIGGLNEKERAKLLSYVPQENDDSLLMSVSDFICMGGINRQSLFTGPDENERRIAKDILKELDALALYDRKMETLSHGQRRLIYLARAIFQDSRIMVLDEPVSSLDLVRQHAFLKHLRDYTQKNGRRVLMSIHDPSLAYEYADAFVFFRNHGSYDVLYRNDPSFKEKFSNDISILYENRIRPVYIDDGVFMSYGSEDPDR
ncbi:MAG: ABC transporter ATP-binding protein [Erysipelotrichaceae bacterium]|nr:ABC transporter ATP-binding protein [Erysipelotrichaceae bacterium]